jgi:hypothetical protein
MKLNKESLFYKYWLRWGCTARGFERLTDPVYLKYYTEGQPNICMIGRIAFIYAPLKTILCAIFLFGILSFIWQYPLQTGLGVIGIVGFFAACVGASWAFTSTAKSVSKTVAWEYVKAVNGRFCTKVEIV